MRPSGAGARSFGGVHLDVRRVGRAVPPLSGMSRRPRSCFAAATFDLLFEVNYILAISFSQRRSSSHVHVCAAPWMGPFGVIPELKEEGALPSRGLVAYLVRFLKKKKKSK